MLVGASSKLVFLFSLLFVLLGGCGADGERAEVPAATLGSSTKAEEIFRPLVRQWALGTKAERQALDAKLTSFARRFEGDDLVRFALVLRAFNALERGELELADNLVKGGGRGALRSPLYGPAGTTRDLATLVAGAVERRRGQPHQALTRLRPLLHKMLDDFATNILDEELVHAALGAHLWLDAVLFLEVWLQEAQPGSEQYVAERVTELLAKIPKEQLLEALEQRSVEGRIGDGDLAREIAQQLATIAVGSRDIGLARRLVDNYKALLGSYGEAVARLAVDTTRGKISARTVGVLLSLRTNAMRRRSADVTAGLAYGLRTQNKDARLVSRHATAEPSDVIRAMSELAGEGAALIIAGVDPMHSEAAARYAADNTLPIILLTPDPTDMGGLSSFIFLLGAEPSQSTKLLVDAMRRDGVKVVAGYGEATSAVEGSAGVGVVRPCGGGATAAELEGERVDGIVAYDGAYCGEELYDVASAVRAKIGVGLGAVGMYPAPKSAYVLRAGVYPFDGNVRDARLSVWTGEGRLPPSWWSALARDAAVLAYEAVENLEDTGAEDESGVRARRQQAAVALAQARATLWTTESRGFVGSQRVKRKIEVVRRD